MIDPSLPHSDVVLTYRFDETRIRALALKRVEVFLRDHVRVKVVMQSTGAPTCAMPLEQGREDSREARDGVQRRNDLRLAHHSHLTPPHSRNAVTSGA